MKKIKTYIQIIAVALLAFGGFFLIYRNIPQHDGVQLYFMDIFNSLMGAVVVALVTASIFIFQRKIESDDEKNLAIYEKKLALYEDLSTKLNEIIQDRKITEEEIAELKSIVFKVILIAGPSAGKKFYEVLVSLNNADSSQIDEPTMKEILAFVTLCRRDLEVLTELDSKEQENLESFLKQIIDDQRVVENISKSKRRFTDEHRRKVIQEYDEASSSEERQQVLLNYKLYPVQITTFRRKLERDSG